MMFGLFNTSIEGICRHVQVLPFKAIVEVSKSLLLQWTFRWRSFEFQICKTHTTHEDKRFDETIN